MYSVVTLVSSWRTGTVGNNKLIIRPWTDRVTDWTPMLCKAKPLKLKSQPCLPLPLGAYSKKQRRHKNQLCVCVSVCLFLNRLKEKKNRNGWRRGRTTQERTVRTSPSVTGSHRWRYQKGLSTLGSSLSSWQVPRFSCNSMFLALKKLFWLWKLHNSSVFLVKQA